MAIGLKYALVFVGLLIWRGLEKGALPHPAIAYLATTAITTATILYAADYGGRLVYRYSVRTSV